MAQIIVTSNGRCSKCGKVISKDKRECSECVRKEIFNKGTSETGGRIY